MTEEDYIELINTELDGELDMEQSIDLKKLLAGSAPAREYRDGLRQMNKMLCELPDLDVPNSFQVVIPENSSKQSKSWISKIFQWPVEFKISMATASLLIVLLSVNQIVVSNTPTDTRALVGTIVNNSQANTDNSDGLESFNYNWLNGSAKLNMTDELYVFTLELNSQDPVTVKINYSQNSVSFVGIAQLNDGIETFDTEEDILQFSHRGENGLSIFLKPEQHEIEKDIQISYAIFSNEENTHTGNLKFR